MKFEDLAEEQKTKARGCQTKEEMLALAREEGYEPTDEELESVSAGWGTCDSYIHCPRV